MDWINKKPASQIKGNKAEKALDLLRGALQPIICYLDNPKVQEIMVNRPDDIWVEELGSMRKIEVRLESVAIDMAMRALASNNDKPLTLLMDARLPGLRIAAVRSPIAVNGHTMCLRKHTARRISLQDYCELGALTSLQLGQEDMPHDVLSSPYAKIESLARDGECLHDFLAWAVRHRHNMLIAGGTSSGKTTLTNALLQAIPNTHRIITIEDTAELQTTTPNHVAFEANPALGVDIRALVRMCLRFRPDRIVVGEVRGAEAYDLVDSLNTGHSGGITTVHADSAEKALHRMENLIRMSPEAANFPPISMAQQIAQTFRYVVHTGHWGNQRGPLRIIEVLGYANNQYQCRELYSRIKHSKKTASN